MTRKILKICLQCKKNFQSFRCEDNKKRGIFCSRRCLGDWRSHNLRGEKAPGWINGSTSKSQKIRNSLKYRLWRTAVFERDDYTCQDCKRVGGYLEVDHIKPFALYPELRFIINNGRTLCQPCHRKTSTYGYGTRKLSQEQQTLQAAILYLQQY